MAVIWDPITEPDELVKVWNMAYASALKLGEHNPTGDVIVAIDIARLYMRQYLEERLVKEAN